MQFSAVEKQAMLKLKGVGATVIDRLEQIGYRSLTELRGKDAATITKQISESASEKSGKKTPKALCCR